MLDRKRIVILNFSCEALKLQTNITEKKSKTPEYKLIYYIFLASPKASFCIFLEYCSS